MKKNLSAANPYLKYAFWIIVALILIQMLNLFDKKDTPNSPSNQPSEQPKPENRPETGEIEFKK